jgi:hypothetical protein
VLLDTDESQLQEFRPPAGSWGGHPSTQRGRHRRGDRAGHGDRRAAAGALVATASFVVLAQRRARQLGMLAAIGGTEKQLRNVTVVNGAVIGAAAAVIGCAVGLVGWALVSPRVEPVVGYRFDNFDLPWLLIVAGMALAVLTAIAAAWWPARAVVRMPIVAALSGRPLQSRPARRSAALALAAASAVSGLPVLRRRFTDGTGERLSWVNVVLISGRVVALVVGLVLASPPRSGCWRPAPRDCPLRCGWLFRLVPATARSGSALAAISLVLAIAVTIIAPRPRRRPRRPPGTCPTSNSSFCHEEVELPFVPDQADVDRCGRRSIACWRAEGASVTELTARRPDLRQDPKLEGRFVVSFARPHGDGWQDVSAVYVATPQLLAAVRRTPDDRRPAF